VKISEKIGSKTRVYFLASKQQETLESWKSALDLEMEKLEAEKAAGIKVATLLMRKRTKTCLSCEKRRENVLF
jgi:hypothetical protein